MTEPATRAAAERAVSFLLDARRDGGWWKDFDILGPSNFWVTAYVGTALARTPHPGARQAAATAWALLVDAQATDGWSYHPGLPADSDSTTWALRLAQQLGRSGQPPVGRGYTLLRNHLQTDGGLATYAMAVAGPAFDRATFVESWAGWTMSHPCVTAAAAALDGWTERARTIEYLCQEQSADGGWRAYWWCDPEYTAGLACEALVAAGQARERVTAAAHWAVARIGADGAVRTGIDPDGSPFATALAARVLACALCADATRGTDAVAAAWRRAVGWLVATQLPDGRWTRTARLRIVPPGVTDPDGYHGWGLDGRGRRSIGTIVVDTDAVFTTATVLGVLGQVPT